MLAWGLLGGNEVSWSTWRTVVEFEPTGKVRLWSKKSQKLDKEPLSYRAASLLLLFETKKSGENLGVSSKPGLLIISSN